MTKMIIICQVCVFASLGLLGVTGGYVILLSLSSAFAKKLSGQWVSFYRIPSKGSSYLGILFSFMDSTNEEITKKVVFG